MKTAQEWWKVFQQPNTNVSIVAIPDIEAIQQDAYRAGLLRAAQVCRDDASSTASLGFGRLCLSNAAKAIEAEAQKEGQ